MVYHSIALHRWRVLARLGKKIIFRLLGPLNRVLQPRIFYGVKKGYHHAVFAEDYNATGTRDEWQKEVYELASQLWKTTDQGNVIDIGCGSGYKLLHYFPEASTTGIEVEPTLSWLRQTYPDRQWLSLSEVIPSRLKAGIVICADVIEHLFHPDELLQFIQQIQFSKLVISTPEREAVAGKSDYGPPENTCHYREWNAKEFREYLSDFFQVENQYIFPGKSTTQVLFCTPKPPRL
jgi:hypothetical protein